MKRYLLLSVSLLLLSGCLGGGGGDGGGSSSSGGGSKKKPQSCNIANGSGQKEWDKATKKYSTTCKVVTCDAGYDNDQDSTQCQETAANFYSPAKDKTRKKCPAPSDSSPTRSTMLSSANGCYKCNSGYLKNTGENTCDVPAQGKYVDSSGSEQSCTNPGGTPGWFNEFVDNTGGVATETGCNFSCKSGFVKNTTTFTCSIPDRGNYADNGVEKSCSSITGDSGGFKTFSANTGAVNSATGCGFSCKAGFVKSGRACNFPRKGKYVNTAGSEQGCDNVGSTPTGGFKEFLDNTGAVPTATDCNFSCNAGYVPSVSTYSCAKAKTCTLTSGHGTGQERWDTITSTYSTTCEVVDCNAGYDSIADTAQCQQTASGFFSLADDKTRKICPTPTNSSPTTTTGLSSADDCYNCNNGYLKNTGENTCDVPSKGNYVNASGNEVSCNSIRLQASATSTWIAGAADDADACLFSCSDGYVKIGRACNTPGLGKYADNGVEKSCSPITGDLGGFDDFAANTGAVTAADGCGFSCNAGFVKSGRSCNFPSSGNYVNASGNEVSCNPITLQRAATSTWIAGAADDADACLFSCSDGYVKIGRACNTPGLGKYADNGVEKACSPITGDLGGFDDFAANTGAVTAADGCGFSCNAGFVKDASARKCNFPSSGNYVDAGNTEQSCTPITLQAPATSTWIAGAADDADACLFSCSDGYVKIGRACNTPGLGKYADNGVEKSCSPITGDLGGFDDFAANMGAVTAADGCDFSCNAGFVKSGRSCNFPSSGNYVDAGNTEQSCTDITGVTGFGSWVSGAATADDACPFSCSAGYTISGRTCRKPKILALGEDTSRILFSNGEVEAWGEVSDHTWRTHLKEDLGGNTPQVLVSGYHHQCIILENAGQIYGRLMCWGQNNFGELGVGDTNPRTTPTAVSATTLGDAGSGVPNTVKFVSTGDLYTCAILKDNTVVCWGISGSLQLGGGISNSWQTASGSKGAPLGSGTANRIAAGTWHTCAVLSDNSVQCWGNNTWGQTGDGGVPSLGTGKTATEIAVGDGISCAILNDASVLCWGDLASPDLGGKTATKIAMGPTHACAILNDKAVNCWGKNTEGQLGGGTPDSGRVLRGTKHDPLGGQAAIEIAAGYMHTCAIMESDNSVKCWGGNIDRNRKGFYGQIVGEVAMTGGSDGTGTSTGVTGTLTAVSTPTATSLDSDASGKICKITLSGGTLGTPWVAKNYTIPLTYNAGGSTAISNAIDNLITAIGSPVNIVGTNVTLAKQGSNKIAATADTAVFEGMTLTIFHDDDGEDCTTSPVGTPVTLSGGSGGTMAEGLWVISEDYTGSGDTTVNLDSVPLDLGTSPLIKEDIADKIVADVADKSWAGKQHKKLPYTATKLDGSSDAGDDCPDTDYCVVFSRVFKGTEGNYGIPFGDRDYEH